MRGLDHFALVASWVAGDIRLGDVIALRKHSTQAGHSSAVLYCSVHTNIAGILVIGITAVPANSTMRPAVEVQFLSRFSL
jgi:hypothetical protein